MPNGDAAPPSLSFHWRRRRWTLARLSAAMGSAQARSNRASRRFDRRSGDQQLGQLRLDGEGRGGAAIVGQSVEVPADEALFRRRKQERRGNDEIRIEPGRCRHRKPLRHAIARHQGDRGQAALRPPDRDMHREIGSALAS